MSRAAGVDFAAAGRRSRRAEAHSRGTNPASAFQRERTFMGGLTMKTNIWRRRLVAAMTSGAMVAGASPVLAVEYANINMVDGSPAHTAPPTVSIPSGQGTAGFFIDSGSVVGEVPIRIGPSATDDAAGGVLITSVAEFGRTTSVVDEVLYATTSVVADDDLTSINTRGGAGGGLAIVTDRGGDNVVAGSSFPIGTGMNANVGAAYFPFSQGWLGGAANGDLVGATIQKDFFGTGDNLVKITGVEDSRRQGILFSTTATNKNNHSVVVATADGVGFNVTSRNNAQNGDVGQADPVSFVFMPLGTPGITMGSIYASAGQTAQPHPVLASGSPFTVTSFTEPAPTPTNPDEVQTKFRLSIPGESPSSGTLILQSAGFLDGNGGNPGDNLITYEADGNEWIIVSDDLPTANGVGQTGGGTGDRQSHFQFAFLPFDTAPGTPVIPELKWSKQTVLAFNAVAHEIDGLDNDNNDGTVGQYVTVPSGTTGVDFFGLRTNLGDNSISADGALPIASDGVMFATASEGLRINSTTTGGLDGYGTVGVSLSGTGSPGTWEVHNGAADPGGGEINVNFSAVLFGADSGFQMAAQQPVAAVGGLQVNIPGVTTQDQGVLMAVNYGNDYQFETVTPNGSGWRIDNLNDAATAVAGEANYIYLPYETENLVAGRVNADGTLIDSTDPLDFTLTTETVFNLDGVTTHLEYLLTINGRTPDQGMLLLNATGEGDSIDNYLVYEPEGNKFRILGLDIITTNEENFGELVEPESTAFSFAFIDFVTPPTLGGGDFLAADFNQDGNVDGVDLTAWKSGFGSGTTKAQGDADADGDVDGTDFLTWQRQFGQAPATIATGAVPEPASALLAGFGLAAFSVVRRRR